MQDRSDTNNSVFSQLPPQYGRGLASDIISLAVPFVLLLGARAVESKEEIDKNKDKNKKNKKDGKKSQAGAGYNFHSPSDLVNEAYSMANSMN